MNMGIANSASQAKLALKVSCKLKKIWDDNDPTRR
jgi:hypothetical protein